MSRINASLNDKQGIFLLNVPESLPQLYTEASALFNKEVKRCFVSGAEVTDIKTLRDQDSVVFTAGEDLSDVQKKQYLHHLAAYLGSFYLSSSLHIKSVAPVLGAGISQLENTAKQIASTSVGCSAISTGVALLGFADDKLDAAFSKFEKTRTAFLNSEPAQLVNQSLLLPVKARADAFLAKATEVYIGLDADKDGKVSVQDFVSAMQQNLGCHFNQHLVDPLKQFYTVISSEISNLLKKTEPSKFLEVIKSKLGAPWSESVASHFHANIQAPAESFYNAAVQTYLTLDSDGDGKVSFADFVAGLKVQLGVLWNSKLLEPANNLHKLLTSAAVKEKST